MTIVFNKNKKEQQNKLGVKNNAKPVSISQISNSKLFAIKNKGGLIGEELLNSKIKNNLKMLLAKLNFKNKLLLLLNKKIIGKSYTKKINDKMNNSLNQSIIYNFSQTFQKNAYVSNLKAKNSLIKNTNFVLPQNYFNNQKKDLIIKKNNIFNLNQSKGEIINLFNGANIYNVNKTLTNITGFSEGKNTIILNSQNNNILTLRTRKNNQNLTKTNQLYILSFVKKIIFSFFKSLNCLSSRPQFIHKNNKVIIKIFILQNNFINKSEIILKNYKNEFSNLFNLLYAKAFLKLNKNKISKTIDLNTKIESISNDLRLKIKIINLIQKAFNSLYNLNYNSNYKNKLNKIIIKEKIKNALVIYYKNQLNTFSNNNNLIKNNINKFNKLGNILAKIFNKKIDLQLIKLYNIGLESNMLAEIISTNSKTKKSQHILKLLNKKLAIYKAQILMKNRENILLESQNKIYSSFSANSNILPANKINLTSAQINDFNKNISTQHTNPIILAKIAGLAIKFGGRLTKEKITPKKTKKVVSMGSFSKDVVNHVESARWTAKNKKGAFSITVKLAHSRTFSTSSKSYTSPRRE